MSSIANEYNQIVLYAIPNTGSRSDSIIVCVIFLLYNVIVWCVTIPHQPEDEEQGLTGQHKEVDTSTTSKASNASKASKGESDALLKHGESDSEDEDQPKKAQEEKRAVYEEDEKEATLLGKFARAPIGLYQGIASLISWLYEHTIPRCSPDDTELPGAPKLLLSFTISLAYLSLLSRFLLDFTIDIRL